MRDVAGDEVAQKIAAAMQREAVRSRAEMDLLIAPSTRTPSHLVTIAIPATAANINLFPARLRPPPTLQDEARDAGRRAAR